MIVDAKKLHKAVKQCKKMDNAFLHIKATGKILTLEAANQRCSHLIYQMIGDCEEDFDVMLEQPSSLESIVAKAKKAGTIGITCEGETLTLRYKKSSRTLKVKVDHGFECRTVDPRHYTENVVKVPTKDLKEMVRRVLISVNKTDADSINHCFHNAIVICDKKKRLGFIGSNGKSLSVVRWPEPMQCDEFKRYTETWGGIRIAYEDLDMMKTAFSDDVVTLVITINSEGQNRVEAYDGNCILVLCEDESGKYNIPRWDGILERKPKHIVKFQSGELLKAVNDSKVFSKGTESPINLVFQEEQVTASCCSFQGKTEYVFPMEWVKERESDVISLDPKYLKAMLKRAKGEIVFGFAHPCVGSCICWFLPTRDWAYIIMPIGFCCKDCGKFRSPMQSRQCKNCGSHICTKCQEAKNKAGLDPDLCDNCNEEL